MSLSCGEFKISYVHLKLHVNTVAIDEVLLLQIMNCGPTPISYYTFTMIHLLYYIIK